MSGRRRRSTENDDSENDSEGLSSEDEESIENEDQITRKDSDAVHDDANKDSELESKKVSQPLLERKSIKKDPAVVPKSGRFFLHDDRDEQIKSVSNKLRVGPPDREQIRPNLGRSKKNDDAWSHDKFEEHQSADNNRRKRNSGPPPVAAKENGVRMVSTRGDQSPIPSPSKVNQEKRSSNHYNETRGNSSRSGGPPRTAPESSAAAYVAASHGSTNSKSTVSDFRVQSNNHDSVSPSENTEKNSPQRSKYSVSNGRTERTSNDSNRGSYSNSRDANRGAGGHRLEQQQQGSKNDARSRDHNNTDNRTRPIIASRQSRHDEHSATAVNRNPVDSVDSQQQQQRSTPSTPVKSQGPPPGIDTPLSATARSFQPTPTHSLSATKLSDDHSTGSHSFTYQDQQQLFDQAGAAEYSTEYDQYSASTGAMDLYSAEQYVQAAYLHQQQMALQMAQLGLSSAADMVLDAYGNAVPLIYGGGSRYHQATVATASGYSDPVWYGSAVDMSQQQAQSGTVYYSAPQHQQQQSASYNAYSSEQSAVGASE